MNLFTQTILAAFIVLFALPVWAAKLDSATIRAAKENAESRIEQMIADIKATAPRYGQGLCGEHFVVEGEISLQEAGSSPYSVPIPLEIREPWGCNPDPAETQKKDPAQDQRFDSTQVAEMMWDDFQRTDGDSMQTLLRVMRVSSFDFKPQTALEGTVKKQRSRPVKNGTIRLENVRSGDSFTGQTDTNGRYSVKVPSGEYKVSFEKKNCKSLSRPRTICGWGPLPGASVRRDKFENFDFATQCSDLGSGGYDGTVDVNIISHPPGINPVSIRNRHEIKVELQQVESRQDAEYWWEGRWTGTSKLTIHTDVPQFDTTVAGLTRGKGHIHDVQPIPTETELEIVLIAGPRGTLAPQSYVKGMTKTDIKVKGLVSAMGQTAPVNKTIPGVGGEGTGPIIDFQNAGHEVSFRMPWPPFDSVTRNYVTMETPEPARITLRAPEEK